MTEWGLPFMRRHRAHSSRGSYRVRLTVQELECRNQPAVHLALPVEAAPQAVEAVAAQVIRIADAPADAVNGVEQVLLSSPVGTPQGLALGPVSHAAFWHPVDPAGTELTKPQGIAVGPRGQDDIPLFVGAAPAAVVSRRPPSAAGEATATDRPVPQIVQSEPPATAASPSGDTAAGSGADIAAGSTTRLRPAALTPTVAPAGASAAAPGTIAAAASAGTTTPFQFILPTPGGPTVVREPAAGLLNARGALNALGVPTPLQLIVPTSDPAASGPTSGGVVVQTVGDATIHPFRPPAGEAAAVAIGADAGGGGDEVADASPAASPTASPTATPAADQPPAAAPPVAPAASAGAAGNEAQATGEQKTGEQKDEAPAHTTRVVAIFTAVVAAAYGLWHWRRRPVKPERGGTVRLHGGGTAGSRPV